MAKLRLNYFDFDGGRGEPARLALHIGGIAFEPPRIFRRSPGLSQAAIGS